MLNDPVKLKGHLKVKLTSKAGGVREYNIPNLVVTTGKNLVAARLVGNSPGPVTHMAIGSSATVPSVADTTLGTQLGRVELDSATSSGNVATFVANFPEGVGTGTIAEAGLFNDGSAGIMISRSTFSPIPKGANDAIEITWTITAT